MLEHRNIARWSYCLAQHGTARKQVALSIALLIEDIWSAGVVILEMISGKYPFSASSEEEMIESILTVLGPITLEQVRDIGVNPMDFPEILAGSTFNARRWSDIKGFPHTLSVELRSLLNQALKYSPRRRNDAATLLNHEFFQK